MIMRIIAGLIIAPAASLGALYGAGLVHTPLAEITSHTQAGGPEPELEPEPERDPPFEPRLELPYDEGDAAVWLASVLAGTGPYPILNSDGQLDLADLAASAATSQTEIAARCEPGHVALSCMIFQDSGDRIGFALQQTDGVWSVMEGSVRIYSSR